MRFLCVAIGLFVSSYDLSHAQDIGKARTWSGDLGRSQFGVFSKDGSRLVYVNGTDAVIEDTESGAKPIRLSGHRKTISAARFSGDGKKIVTVGQDETIRTWDSDTGKPLTEIRANTSVPGTVLTVSQNGNLIGFSAGNDQILRMLDLTKNAERQRIGLTNEQVVWRSVTLDGRYAMSNGIENGSKIWEMANGTSITIDNGHHNYCGQFSYDGTRAILAGGFQWDIWDLRHRTRLVAGTVTGGHIYSIASSPPGDKLLTGLGDGTIWLWDMRTGKETHIFREHKSAIKALMFSPDRRFAISEDKDSTIVLWRLPK